MGHHVTTRTNRVGRNPCGSDLGDVTGFRQEWVPDRAGRDEMDSRFRGNDIGLEYAGTAAYQPTVLSRE